MLPLNGSPSEIEMDDTLHGWKESKIQTGGEMMTEQQMMILIAIAVADIVIAAVSGSMVGRKLLDKLA